MAQHKSLFANVKHSYTSGDDTEGEAREDQEQNKKLADTIELLLAAGYFRARIKGLTPFDKIVGGMTWCIVTCSVDLDIDLLFQENATIGQKIALTEKIVAVLPQMKCPHRIEPHQIQGLDFINIYPVVQWLVRRAIETREEMGDTIRMFSESQFNKSHSLPQDEEFIAKLKKAALAVGVVQLAYKPQRKYKRPSATDDNDEEIQIHSTLLEYGRRYGIGRQPPSDKDTETAAKKKALAAGLAGRTVSDDHNEQAAEERRIASLMSGMAVMEGDERLSSKAVASIVGQQSDQIQLMASEYESKRAELDEADISTGSQAHSRMVSSLDKQITNYEKRLAEVSIQHEKMQKLYKEGKKRLQEARDYSEQIATEMKQLNAMETDENREVLQQLRNLVAMNESLKQQEKHFKAHCKEEMSRLQKEIQRLESGDDFGDPEERQRLEMISSQYEVDRAKFQKIRLLLARRNREIALLQRKIDEVPSRTELNQYQRRFIELFNQMAATLTETKKFYTLYNTLDDKKLYLQKEVSLLNSIHDNFHTAMSSAANKEQFLKQFEVIVEGIKQNKAKVEERKVKERARRDELQDSYTQLQQQQRQYYKMVRDFQEECSKNEMLVAKLKARQTSTK
ncbi:coiled-coil domain-containing protein 93-like [Corticium candelabrum]|uniref:coiled-coil domain-containing protein 93-like n=1 Tax=Corticium candelabrum TaxID=121492 RepID=UPI002E265616|nr:coiled-coil domain-containing protein 93-like [Corticium candelabrum]